MKRHDGLVTGGGSLFEDTTRPLPHSVGIGHLATGVPAHHTSQPRRSSP